MLRFLKETFEVMKPVRKKKHQNRATLWDWEDFDYSSLDLERKHMHQSHNEEEEEGTEMRIERKKYLKVQMIFRLSKKLIWLFSELSQFSLEDSRCFGERKKMRDGSLNDASQ